MAFRRFTPQQKKKMRLLKDRRNAYGENDKASRRIIRLRKRIINRTYRRNIKQKLMKNNDLFIDEYSELTDIEINNIKRRFWKKYPDISLKEHIKLQKEARKKRINRKKK